MGDSRSFSVKWTMRLIQPQDPYVIVPSSMSSCCHSHDWWPIILKCRVECQLTFILLKKKKILSQPSNTDLLSRQQKAQMEINNTIVILIDFKHVNTMCTHMHVHSFPEMDTTMHTCINTSTMKNAPEIDWWAFAFWILSFPLQPPFNNESNS